MTKMATRFVPRPISAEQAAQGFNNEGRGKLIGYIARPEDHEATCRYRITCRGNPDNPHESCNCRIGLWQDTTPTQRVVNEMRKSVKRTRRRAPKAKSRKKAKRKSIKAKGRK